MGAAPFLSVMPLRTAATASVRQFPTDLHSVRGGTFHGEQSPGAQAALQQLQAIMLSCFWVFSRLKSMESTILVLFSMLPHGGAESRRYPGHLADMP